MKIKKENLIFGGFLALLAVGVGWAGITIYGNNKVINDTKAVLADENSSNFVADVKEEIVTTSDKNML